MEANSEDADAASTALQSPAAALSIITTEHFGIARRESRDDLRVDLPTLALIGLMTFRRALQSGIEHHGSCSR